MNLPAALPNLVGAKLQAQGMRRRCSAAHGHHGGWVLERARKLSSDRRPGAPSNSKLHRRHVVPWLNGSIGGAAIETAGCSQAECIQPSTSRPANIFGW